MAKRTYYQTMKIKDNYRAEIQRLFPNVKATSGIYILTREEGGIKFAYVGQAVNILERMVGHRMGYEQWIDRSIKSHKWYSEDNITGWRIEAVECPRESLDEAEKYYIREYAKTHQMRNITAGGQGEGKVYINEPKQGKGYREGVAYGRKKLGEELKHIIDLHLEVGMKKNNKSNAKALEKFWTLLNEGE